LTISVAIQDELGQECTNCRGSPAQDRQNPADGGFELPVVNPN
jgi:hypothetical protein